MYAAKVMGKPFRLVAGPWAGGPAGWVTWRLWRRFAGRPRAGSTTSGKHAWRRSLAAAALPTAAFALARAARAGRARNPA